MSAFKREPIEQLPFKESGTLKSETVLKQFNTFGKMCDRKPEHGKNTGPMTTTLSENGGQSNLHGLEPIKECKSDKNGQKTSCANVLIMKLKSDHNTSLTVN